MQQTAPTVIRIKWREIKIIMWALSVLLQAKDPRIFWTWLNRQFVNGIYAGKWYNDEKVKEQEYIGDKMSILLGVPRLRQLRVQKGKSDILIYSKTAIVRMYITNCSLSENK